jgi:hypothetical protein
LFYLEISKNGIFCKIIGNSRAFCISLFIDISKKKQVFVIKSAKHDEKFSKLIKKLQKKNNNKNWPENLYFGP